MNLLKKILIVLIISLSIFLFSCKSKKTTIKKGYNVVSDGLICVKNSDNKVGYINEDEKVVIDFKYVSGNSFVNGSALVSKEEYNSKIDKNEIKYYLINKKDKIVAGPYDNASVFYGNDDVVYQTVNYSYLYSNNSSTIVDIKECLLVNSAGKEIFNEKCYIYKVYPGILRYSSFNDDHNRLYGLLDFEGNKICPCLYKEIYEFNSEGYGFVQNQDDKWGLIDTKGNIVLDLKYTSIMGFNDYNLARVTLDDTSYVINYKGDILFSTKDIIYSFNDKAVVTKDSSNKYDIYGYDNNLILTCSNEPGLYDLIFVYNNEKYNVYRYNGELALSSDLYIYHNDDYFILRSHNELIVYDYNENEKYHYESEYVSDTGYSFSLIQDEKLGHLYLNISKRVNHNYVFYFYNLTLDKEVNKTDNSFCITKIYNCIAIGTVDRLYYSMYDLKNDKTLSENIYRYTFLVSNEGYLLLLKDNKTYDAYDENGNKLFNYGVICSYIN